MTAAATRDDLLSVVSALTVSAVEQRRWEQEYRVKAETSFLLANENNGNPLLYAKYRSEQNMFERFAAQAAGTANAFEISADMINKYVSVEPGRCVMTLEDRNVWKGGTPGVKAVLAFMDVVMNRDGSPKSGVSLNDGVQAAVTAYDKAYTENGWIRIHPTDSALIERVRAATESTTKPVGPYTVARAVLDALRGGA